MNGWDVEMLNRVPEEFQQLNPNSYMQRRNIVKIENEELLDNGETRVNVSYKCESRIITKDQYLKYIEEMNSPSTINNNENMTIIMAAIADLYEKVATLSSNTP